MPATLSQHSVKLMTKIEKRFLSLAKLIVLIGQLKSKPRISVIYSGDLSGLAGTKERAGLATVAGMLLTGPVLVLVLSSGLPFTTASSSIRVSMR